MTIEGHIRCDIEIVENDPPARVHPAILISPSYFYFVHDGNRRNGGYASLLNTRGDTSSSFCRCLGATTKGIAQLREKRMEIATNYAVRQEFAITKRKVHAAWKKSSALRSSASVLLLSTITAIVREKNLRLHRRNVSRS